MVATVAATVSLNAREDCDGSSIADVARDDLIGPDQNIVIEGMKATAIFDPTNGEPYDGIFVAHNAVNIQQ